jgi:hypothetical protein
MRGIPVLNEGTDDRPPFHDRFLARFRRGPVSRGLNAGLAGQAHEVRGLACTFRPVVEAESGVETGISTRKAVAGLAAVAVALLMLRLPLGWFLHRRPITWVGHEGISRTGFDWFGLVAAAVTLAIGLCFLIKPDAVARWIVRKNPQRLYPSDFVKGGGWGLRIFGILVVMGGILVMWTALR